MIEINSKLCKGCLFCVDACPKDVLEKSHELNEIGKYLPVVVCEEGCIVCRMCELRCPDFAIFVMKKKGDKIV